MHFPDGTGSMPFGKGCSETVLLTNPPKWNNPLKITPKQRKKAAFAAFTSRIRFIAQADKRHCSVTRSMPRLYVRLKLCSAFWWEKLPSHQIFRSLSAAKYSGVFRLFACSCRASSCSIRSTMRLFLELPTHCCRQAQLLHYLIEFYIAHHT